MPGFKFYLEFIGSAINKTDDIKEMIALEQYKSVSERVLSKKLNSYVYQEMGYLKQVLDEFIINI